jgi:hypothetical protein
MKKIALTALAAAIAAGGLMTTAKADSRYGDDDDQWRRHGQHDGGDWDGRRDDDRHAWDERDRDGWRWRDDGDGWRFHHPRYVYRPHWREDFCFVKKIRRYDAWGNLYIKRVRICR